MDNTFNIDSPYLQHYGVLGMKWGIRRYQNPDGTLTAAGRRRVKRAMRQHDIVMTTRDTHDRDKEYRYFRRMVTNMYPAEVAELTLRVEQANAIKKLSDLQTEDKISKGLEYTNKVMQIAASTGTAIGNFASAANTISQVRERHEKIEQRKLESEKARDAWNKEKRNNASSIIQDIKDIKDAKDKIKNGTEAAADAVKKATETPKNQTEAKGVKGETWVKKPTEPPKTTAYTDYVVNNIKTKSPPKLSDYVSMNDSPDTIKVLSETGSDYVYSHEDAINRFLEQSKRSTSW